MRIDTLGSAFVFSGRDIVLSKKFARNRAQRYSRTQRRSMTAETFEREIAMAFASGAQFSVDYLRERMSAGVVS